LFELTRPDLGLWVLELDFSQEAVQATQISEICRQVQANSAHLRGLNEGSTDYTLHLTFHLPEHERILLPPLLSRLASEWGLSLELYVTKDG
jgi:hypothetical protein